LSVLKNLNHKHESYYWGLQDEGHISDNEDMEGEGEQEVEDDGS